MTHLLPVFIGQSIIGLIVIVTHLGLYLALRRLHDTLDEIHIRVKTLEKRR